MVKLVVDQPISNYFGSRFVFPVFSYRILLSETDFYAITPFKSHFILNEGDLIQFYFSFDF